MSGRKNRFVHYPLSVAGEMSNGFTSVPTNIQGLDNVGYQMDFTGAPTGTFAVQVSANYQQDFLGNVLAAGNWIPISLPTTPAAAGTTGNIYLDLNQLSAPWVRLVYVSTVAGQQTITTRADVAGNLASKYFLISDAAQTHKYAVWFKVSGTGTGPSVTGYTNEEVDITTADTASTVATATAAVVNALPGFTSAAAIGAVITVINSVAGNFTVASNGATLSTGFTFAATTGAGSLNAYITGKMV